MGKDDADESFTRSLLPIVQRYPELFGSHAQAFSSPNARTALLELAHRMATLIMAYGFDIEPEMSSEEDDDDEEEGEEISGAANGSAQFVYKLNKGMVPLADLFNADGDRNNVCLCFARPSKQADRTRHT